MLLNFNSQHADATKCHNEISTHNEVESQKQSEPILFATAVFNVAAAAAAHDEVERSQVVTDFDT